jgi:hypothetical protein
MTSISCLENPEAVRRLLCFPCPIKARYYPWALAAFFFLLNGFATDFVVGVLVGHMCAWVGWLT